MQAVGAEQFRQGSGVLSILDGQLDQTHIELQLLLGVAGSERMIVFFIALADVVQVLLAHRDMADGTFSAAFFFGVGRRGFRLHRRQHQPRGGDGTRYGELQEFHWHVV